MLANPYPREHAFPQGPGDARPTAMQVIKDQNLVRKMGGMVALITGATSGIGLETARALHATGADVYFTARTHEKGQKALGNIRASSTGTGKLGFIVMELSSFDSIRKGAADFLSKSKSLNILIANAGVMASPKDTTEDGFEVHFGVNYLSHFLLFHELESTMSSSSKPAFNSRVISVSSAAHRFSDINFDDYNMKDVDEGDVPFVAFGQSKTAQIYMANEIERRYGSKGLHGWSVYPGGSETPIVKHMDPSIMEGVRSNPTIMGVLKSPEQAAATTVWAAVAKELEGWGGKYLDDCYIAGPRQSSAGTAEPGYVPFAYDEKAEQRLWQDSLKMIGAQKDE